MNSIVHDTTGLIHLISAVFALGFGTAMLKMKKGTPIHKRIGYAYSVCMLILIGTAFNSYHLFGTFGPFHFGALFSLFTMAMGLVPVLLRKPAHNWLGRHMSWMYFSVIGLYAAFTSEVLVRIPNTPFAFTVTVASFLTVFIGMWFFYKKRTEWMRKYSHKI